MPSGGNNSGRAIEIEGRPNQDPANPPQVDYRVATPDVFAVLQIPILRGRGFSDADREGGQPVAIVTQSLAQRLLPGHRSDRAPHQDRGRRSMADGRGRLRRRHPGLVHAPQLPDAVSTAGAGPDPFDGPADQNGRGSRRGGGGRARGHQGRGSGAGRCSTCMPMRDTLKERTLGLQYVGAIMIVLGGIALVLAVVGVYGLMAFMVTQRTHEIGVRMALGATRRDVLRLAVGQTVTLDGARRGRRDRLLVRARPADRSGTPRRHVERSPAGRRPRRDPDPGIAGRRLPSGAPCGFDRPDGRASGRVTEDRRS